MAHLANLSDYLRKRASEYFGDMHGERVQVELRRTRRRINSTLHDFIVTDGNSEYALLVKSPTLPKPKSPTATANRDHPRLFPKVRPEEKSKYEFETMSAIEDHIARLADQRFAAVRMFELLPDGHSLVMEKVAAPSMNELLNRQRHTNPRSAPQPMLDRVARNAGAWLRYYHAHSPLKHTRSRNTTRTEFIESVSTFAEHAGRVSNRSYYECLIGELTSLAEWHLPPTMPLGLAHGDYTPSNVLADPDGRIRIIDTLGRWNAPIYEDLARFVTMLRLATRRVWASPPIDPPQHVARLEQQFLAGYFGDGAAPIGCIRIFQCQTLLACTAAYSYRYRESRGWKKIIKGGRAMRWNAFTRKSLERLIADIRPVPSKLQPPVQEFAI